MRKWNALSRRTWDALNCFKLLSIRTILQRQRVKMNTWKSRERDRKEVCTLDWFCIHSTSNIRGENKIWNLNSQIERTKYSRTDSQWVSVNLQKHTIACSKKSNEGRIKILIGEEIIVFVPQIVVFSFEIPHQTQLTCNKSSVNSTKNMLYSVSLYVPMTTFLHFRKRLRIPVRERRQLFSYCSWSGTLFLQIFDRLYSSTTSQLVVSWCVLLNRYIQ